MLEDLIARFQALPTWAQIGIPAAGIGGVALIAMRGKSSSATTTASGPGVSAGGPSSDSGGGGSTTSGGGGSTTYIPTAGPGGGGTTGASVPGMTVPNAPMAGAPAAPSGNVPLTPQFVGQETLNGQTLNLYGFQGLPSTFMQGAGPETNPSTLPSVYATDTGLPQTNAQGEYLTQVGGPSTGYAYTYSSTPPPGSVGASPASQPGPTHTAEIAPTGSAFPGSTLVTGLTHAQQIAAVS